MKHFSVYRRHNCAGRHGTDTALAVCLWPAHRVFGAGRWAVVVFCRPHRSVELVPTLDDADVVLNSLTQGCGRQCVRRHQIVYMNA